MAVFSGLPAKALGAIEKRDAIDLEKLTRSRKALNSLQGPRCAGGGVGFSPASAGRRCGYLCCRGGDIAR